MYEGQHRVSGKSQAFATYFTNCFLLTVRFQTQKNLGAETRQKTLSISAPIPAPAPYLFFFILVLDKKREFRKQINSD